MQPDLLEVLSPFLIGRLRAGDDLRDGVFLRSREMMSLPSKPVWSEVTDIERVKLAWAARPVTAKRDETGEDWARMLRPVPRTDVVTDLANLRVVDVSPSRIPMMRLLRPLLDEISVSGVGAGIVPTRHASGMPRARAAGIAAFVIYARSVRRFSAVLPPDLARAASESVRVLLTNQLSSLEVSRLDEVRAELAFIKARFVRVNTLVAERVLAAHVANTAPDLHDIAFLFAYPSSRYRVFFEDLLKPEKDDELAKKNEKLYQVYDRGGAFIELKPYLKSNPTPDASPLEDGAAISIEGDREMDVGLEPTVSLVIGAHASLVPRSADKLRARLVHDRILANEATHPVSGSREFRWMPPAVGGVYRVRIDALDVDGDTIATGTSGELRVTQFAYCTRCSRRVDFSRAGEMRERVCTWSASPRPGTLPSSVSSKDFEMLARYGDNERVRKAARLALNDGRISGTIVVAGEPAAPMIEYRGVHSPKGRHPDLPRLSNGRFLRGSLVVRHADEMLALEDLASDEDIPQADRERAVERLRTFVEGIASVKRLAIEPHSTERLVKEILRLDALANEESIALQVWLANHPVSKAIAVVDEPVDMDSIEEAEVLKILEQIAVFQTGVESLFATLAQRFGEIARHIREVVRLTADFDDPRISDVKSRLTFQSADAALREIREGFDNTKTKAEDLKRRANERIAALEALRQVGADREAWSTRANALLAEVEAFSLPEAIVSLGKDFVFQNFSAAPVEQSNVRALREYIKQAARDYRQSSEDIAKTYQLLADLGARRPAQLDQDLLTRVETAIAEKDPVIGAWNAEAKAADNLDVAWAVVDGYLKALADFEGSRVIIGKLIVDLASDAMIRSDDFDDRLKESDHLRDLYQEEYDKLLDTRAFAIKEVSKLDANLADLPENPIAIWSTTRDATELARIEFLAKAAKRASESAKDAKARRRQEFEASSEVVALEAAIRDLELDELEALTARIPPNFDKVRALDDQIVAVEELLDGLTTPDDTPADEIDELLGPLRIKVSDLTTIRSHEKWKTAILTTVTGVMNRSTDFRQQTPETAKTSQDSRLETVDQLLAMMNRAATFGDTFANSTVRLTERRALLVTKGDAAISRLTVNELIAILIAEITVASGELAATSSDVIASDLAEAVTDLLAFTDDQHGRIGELDAVDENIREAVGQHSRKYGSDAKTDVLTGAGADVARLLVQYKLEAEAAIEARLGKVLAALEGSSEIATALTQVARLTSTDATEKIKDALQARSDSTFADLSGRVNNVNVPSVDDLQTNRADASLSLAVLKSLSDKIPDGLEQEKKNALTAQITATEVRIRFNLMPARTAALARIFSAITLSRYGGDDAKSALDALEFLIRDDVIYGEVKFPTGIRTADELNKTLDRLRGEAIGDKRCSLEAYVKMGNSTCALDSIVMLAAKSDLQIMGRMLAAKPADDCATQVSNVLRHIDASIGAGKTSESRCNELRDAMIACAKTEPGLLQVLYHQSNVAKPKEMLDAADVLAWLNSKYDIETTQLMTVPEEDPTGKAMSHQISWPYMFAETLFVEDEFHNVLLADPETAPRSFAIGSDAEIMQRLMESKTVATSFDRWGWAYELVAILHSGPGHYWLSGRCRGGWFRYDGVRSPPVRSIDVTDKDFTKSARVIFYERRVRLTPRGEVLTV